MWQFVSGKTARAVSTLTGGHAWSAWLARPAGERKCAILTFIEESEIPKLGDVFSNHDAVRDCGQHHGQDALGRVSLGRK